MPLKPEKVEELYLQARGYLPTDRDRMRVWFDKCGMELPPEEAPRVSIRAIVALVAQKYQLLASQCWGETLADLVLMLEEQQPDGASNAVEAAVMAVEARERGKLLEQLTPAELQELEQWKDTYAD